jgi:hypothetical protein
MTRHCACCGKLFEPIPQVPHQTFCSLPDCQRARRRQGQRAKRQSDPDYKSNQSAAQQKWAQNHPDYWRNYRKTRTAPASGELGGDLFDCIGPVSLWWMFSGLPFPPMNALPPNDSNAHGWNHCHAE